MIQTRIANLSKVSYERLVHFRKPTETNIQGIIAALRREFFAVFVAEGLHRYVTAN